MSTETEFRTVLTGYSALTALVPAARIAQNAVTQGAVAPYIVFSAQHSPEWGLDNTLHATAVTVSVECWADTAVAADAVADQVAAALLAQGHVWTSRASAYDAEIGLDGTVLSFEWWDT